MDETALPYCDTVDAYIGALRESYLFYPVRRYDTKGKRYLSTQAKHYVADIGMRYAALGTRNMDWSRMYEHAVYLELVRREYEAYVSKFCQKEVDFVAKRRSKLVHAQVSDDISSKRTFEREVDPLLRIRKPTPNCSSRARNTRHMIT